MSRGYNKVNGNIAFIRIGQFMMQWNLDGRIFFFFFFVANSENNSNNGDTIVMRLPVEMALSVLHYKYIADLYAILFYIISNTK